MSRGINRRNVDLSTRVRNLINHPRKLWWVYRFRPAWHAAQAPSDRCWLTDSDALYAGALDMMRLGRPGTGDPPRTSRLARRIAAGHARVTRPKATIDDSAPDRTGAGPARPAILDLAQAGADEDRQVRSLQPAGRSHALRRGQSVGCQLVNAKSEHSGNRQRFVCLSARPCKREQR